MSQMVHQCRTCKRFSPAQATYCYFDGTVLDSHARPKGPEDIAEQAFPHPFYFSSGRVCKNFNELALACNDLWAEARDMLRQGDMASFLGGLGRSDLASTARAAAKEADLDRALDGLLARLPSKSLKAPKLELDRLEVNLGSVPVGQERQFTLQMTNAGDRLLQGVVVCENTPWLTVGQAGAADSLFQFTHDQALTVRVQGKALRANPKPQEGKLNFRCGSDEYTVVVRIDVPVQAFPKGALLGAKTPREAAQKCMANPREAAPLFEEGSVRRWYESNGWTYPVQIPTAAGVAAVQQFFEALGVTKAPKVEINTTGLNLSASVGNTLEEMIEVSSPEKKAVYAHATSDQPWLQVGTATLAGRFARIPVRISPVPNAPNGPLQGRITVQANGNTRFTVPVTLNVSGSTNRPPSSPSFTTGRPPLVVEAEPLDALPVGGGMLAPPPPPPPPPGGYTNRSPQKPVSTASMDALPELAEPLPEPRGKPIRAEPVSEEKKGIPPLLHLIPVAVLVLILLGFVLRDFLSQSGARGGGLTGGEDVVQEPISLDPVPRITVEFHDSVRSDRDDRPPNGVIPPTMRFGITMINPEDSKRPLLRLTYDPYGRTNNTCLHIDGRDGFFGHPADTRLIGYPSGTWVKQEEKSWRESDGSEHKGTRSIWMSELGKIQVTQTVEVIHGQMVRDSSSKLVRYRDTCLVRYLLENKDFAPHTVGIRFLLDTFIGNNDGVPFLIPGEVSGCNTAREFSTRGEVPEYVLALEKNDLANPGLVARAHLKVGGVESPDRVTLGAWPDGLLRPVERKSGDALPNGPYTLWQVPVLSMQTVTSFLREGRSAPADSALVMYWKPASLKPNEKREVGFAYGVGRIAGNEAGGALCVITDGLASPGVPFLVQAVVSEPASGQTLTLELPPGLKLVDGRSIERVPPVPADATRKQSTVTWRVQGEKLGTYKLTVKSSTGISQSRPVSIRKPDARDIFSR